MADPSQVQTRVGRELSSMPMGSMIASIAKGIAEGQWELDKTSMTVAELMSGQRLVRDLETGKLLDEYDQELPDGKAPRVIDSRVFFGFTYVRSEDIPEATATASSVQSAQVKTITVDEKGVYDFAPTIEILDDGGEGEGATAVAVMEDVETGSSDFKTSWVGMQRISSITVTDGGSNYTEASTRVVITGGLAATSLRRVPQKVSMMELGFAPNFYQFVDTVIEIKIAVKMTRNRDTSKQTGRKTESRGSSGRSYVGWGRRRSHGCRGWYTGGGWGNSRHQSANATSVNSTYSSKYSYSVEASSMVRTKLVPIPPPAILEERIRELMEAEREYQERLLGKF